MPRPSRSDEEIRKGELLGQELQRVRGERTAASVAASAGVSVDTVRRIEQGGVASPGFFLVGKLAAELRVDLDDLYESVRARELGTDQVKNTSG